MKKGLIYLILCVLLCNYSYSQNRTVSKEEFTEIIKKGNRVYIEIPDDVSRAGEKYFDTYLTEWGYWKIVSNRDEANFIIVFNITNKGMGDKKVSATFLTKDGIEFLKSKNYKVSTTAFNGYNAYWAAAKKIVKKYFRKYFY